VTFKYTHSDALVPTENGDMLGCYHLKWTRNTQRGESESFRVFLLYQYTTLVYHFPLYLLLSVVDLVRRKSMLKDVICHLHFLPF